MSRRKQRGPLLKGALDVLELPVPDLEAGGQQRKGASKSFIGFTRSPSNTHAEPSSTAPRRSGVCRSVPVSITRAKATAASTLHRDVGAAGYVPVGGAKVPATPCDLARDVRLRAGVDTRQSLPSPARWRQRRRHQTENIVREIQPARSTTG